MEASHVTHYYHQSRFTADRKSTRLNSSHSQISYAVFCLKKKNTRARSSIASHQLAQPLDLDFNDSSPLRRLLTHDVHTVCAVTTVTRTPPGARTNICIQ